MPTGITDAAAYAGIVYYEEKGVEDLMTFTAAKRLNALQKEQKGTQKEPKNSSLKEELAKQKEEHRNEQLTGTESVHDHDGMYVAVGCWNEHVWYFLLRRKSKVLL